MLAWQRASEEPKQAITSFRQCQDAGGVIMEIYPEQCAIGGKTFVNEEQSSGQDVTSQNYEGLGEQEALDTAADENIPARVVERDDEALPVTMDYVSGRLNLYVRDEVVYRVVVEGEE